MLKGSLDYHDFINNHECVACANRPSYPCPPIPCPPIPCPPMPYPFPPMPCPCGAEPRGPAGTIIPFSSGTHIELEATTTRNQVAFVGFGQSYKMAAPANPIHLSPAAGTAQLAFSMPSNGRITALSVFLSSGAAIAADTTAFVSLFASAAPDNNFTPIGVNPVSILIPALSMGEFTRSVNQDLSVEISRGTRILVVVYAISTGTNVPVAFHLSGGIKIES